MSSGNASSPARVSLRDCLGSAMVGEIYSRVSAVLEGARAREEFGSLKEEQVVL